MWSLGTSCLGDRDLLAVILGHGTRGHPVLSVADQLIETSGGVSGLSRASPRELSLVPGIGVERGARVAAAFELGRRAVDMAVQRVRVASRDDVRRALATRVAGLDQELLFVIGVDARNQLLDIVEVARGSLAKVETHPREIFRPLIRMGAFAGILAHNHPSGHLAPSHSDLTLTAHMREIGELICLPIVDHIVVTGGGAVSLGEWVGTEVID
jgi:DNA repair protein RadC